MPLAHIYVTGPKSAAHKRALLEGTRDAIVEALAAPAERVVVRLTESDAECVDVPDCRTDRFVLVEVLLYEGRSEEVKRAFSRTLRQRFGEVLGIDSSEVAIALHDLTKVDLDVLPGQAAD